MIVDESATIESVSMKEVAIPLAIPFRISGGTCRCRKSLIIELRCGSVTGYGESAPFEAPFYSSETVSSAKAVLVEWLLPRVVGRSFSSIEDLNEVLSEGIRGNQFAKAGVENAYWDLVARRNRISLKELVCYKLQRLRTPAEYLTSTDYVEAGVSVGIPEDESLDTLREWVDAYRGEGYRRIKIKIRPGWDLRPVAMVREMLGTDFPFWVDANASFCMDRDAALLKDMDCYKCLFYEQPLHHDDLLDHSRLARMIETPICLDESLKSHRVGRQALELGGMGIWNIKVQRVGGLLEALKLYDLAVRHEVALWGGTMPETGIGAVPILVLASFAGFKYPADVEPSRRWYGPGHDLIEMEMSPDGRIPVPKGKGIGEIDTDNCRRYGAEVVELRP